MTLISVSNVGVDFGPTTLLSDVTFTVAKGERWGVIGRNGSGKTTLFKLITGAMAPTRGQIAKVGGLRISYMEQHRGFGGTETVWEAAAGPFSELQALELSLAEQTDAIAAAGERVAEAQLDRYAHDLERFEREGGYTYAPRVDAVLHGLGFDPATARERKLSSLSGGERGRVGLARQLVAPVDVLLLDEPTNHLDLETTQWLEDYLVGSDLTVLLVSHDRAFLERVIDHVLHVEARTAVPYNGGFSAFVAQRAERRLALSRQVDKQRKTIAAEEDYIRRNIAGQNTRQAKGRRKKLARLPRLSPPPGEEGTMSLRLEVAERGGDRVLAAEKARLAIGERVLLEHFTATIDRGDVVGLIGPNGAGKSTLLNAMVGRRETDGGALRLGLSTAVAYYEQELTQLPTEKTIYDVIGDQRPLWSRGQVQGHLGRFSFSGDEVQRKVATLSGGERARVALASIMLSRANFLVFDEPTNHLDVESIEALEDAIESYEGTVLLVSHDRALLRALATRVWVLHNRRITDFAGSFAEWEEVSRERAHAARVQAQEEESLRRLHEKQRLERQASSGNGGRPDQRQARRDAARRLERAERDAEKWEKRVAELTQALEDPALYTQPDAKKRTAAMGKELDAAKKALDSALAEWAEAEEGV